VPNFAFFISLPLWIYW